MHKGTLQEVAGPADLTARVCLGGPRAHSGYEVVRGDQKISPGQWSRARGRSSNGGMSVSPGESGNNKKRESDKKTRTIRSYPSGT